MPCAKLLEIEIIKKGLTFVIDDEYFFSRASFIAFALLYKIKFNSADLHVLQFIDNN